MRPNGYIPKRNVIILPPPRDPEIQPGPPAVAGVDFIQAPFPHPLQAKDPLCILQAFHFYIHEHVIPMGADMFRTIIIARYMASILGAATVVEELKRADGRLYESTRLEDGVKGASIRKEVAITLAAFNWNREEGERIKIVPPWKLPDVTYAKRRPMTNEEYQRLMRQPMSFRLRMFNRLAYYTGHRSRAIELLPWARVDMVNWTIDFNEPGARRHNKRRVDGFPIPDGLKPYLVAAWERRQRLGLTDPYVIGVSRRGLAPSTYHEQCASLARAGIKEKGLVPRHSIRKNFVTELVRMDGDWLKVAELIGDDAKTMKDHYLELGREDLRATVNRR
jgi:integrase